MDTTQTPAERFAARCLADRIALLAGLTPEQIERRAALLDTTCHNCGLRPADERASDAAGEPWCLPCVQEGHRDHGVHDSDCAEFPTTCPLHWTESAR